MKWKFTEEGIIHAVLEESDHDYLNPLLPPFIEKMKKIPDRKFYNSRKVSHYKDRAKMLIYPEYIFASVFGLKINTEIYEFGDPGYDFIMNGRKVEVRTAPWIKGYFPLRDDKKNLRYDVGILIASPEPFYDPKRKISWDEAMIVGYLTKSTVKDHAINKPAQGQNNWIIEQENLKPIKEFCKWDIGG